jgi:hypothetical protein
LHTQVLFARSYSPPGPQLQAPSWQTPVLGCWVHSVRGSKNDPSQARRPFGTGWQTAFSTQTWQGGQVGSVALHETSSGGVLSRQTPSSHAAPSQHGPLTPAPHAPPVGMHATQAGTHALPLPPQWSPLHAAVETHANPAPKRLTQS